MSYSHLLIFKLIKIMDRIINTCIMLAIVTITIACGGVKEDENYISKDQPLQTIRVSISDSIYENVNDLLEMDSYLILSSDVYLGEIERAIIVDERLYVLDSQPKIVCFNPDGTVRYQIASKGRGPGEFLRIVDFSVDSENNHLKLYDSSRRKLLNFSLSDGKFVDEQGIDIAPMGLASFDGGNYFHNPYTINYPDSKEFHYSLLWAKNDLNIEKKHFPHDPLTADFYFTFGKEHPFFYNSEHLLYNTRFESIVYSLVDGEAIPLYDIQLPNPMPKNYLKENPEGMELLSSGYSVVLSDIYQCENILYFSFVNNIYCIFSFYDLEKQELIYCGGRVLPKPSKALPVYYPIRGVYKNRFFTFVNPSTILKLKQDNFDVIPKKMLSIQEYDNPVLVFYSLKK